MSPGRGGRFSNNWVARGRGRGGPPTSWSQRPWSGPRGGFNNRGGGGNFRRGGTTGQWRGRGNAGRFRGQHRPETPGKRLAEKDIGVTEYISENTGFNGIIKFRYSDFQVSEINLKGEIACLTTLDPPERPVVDSEAEDDDDLLSRFDLEVLPMDTWDRINALVIPAIPTNEKVEIDVTGKSKEERTKIHDAVKKVFQDSIVGSTVTTGDQKFVTFERYRKGVRIDNRTKWVWPMEYVYFVVHKENCDTMNAASRIASRLGILGSGSKINNLSYAGTKDRRAKTSQWFSIRKYDPKKIALACKDMEKIHIGNYSFNTVPLKLGMLKGNRFRIALRNIVAPESIVQSSCAGLRDRGFINYYGLQRFGTNVDVPTFDTGRKLMQGDYRGAISNILESRSYQTHRDAPEAKLQRAIDNNSKDLHGALSKIPRNTRLLYLHSYQSYLWNRAVTHRLRTLGWKLCVGDLVPETELAEEEELDSDNESDTERESQETDTKKKDEILQLPKAKEQKVRAVTQSDIDSDRYSMFDIVLPLPGYDITYPENMKEHYEKMLAEDGLNLELRNKIKAYSMSGAYRRVVCKVSSMSWKLVSYSDANSDLIRSDVDLLNGMEDIKFEEDGKYKALLLDMSLPASSYATMALRELMKVDTNSDFQASQNSYHLENKRDGEVTSQGEDKNQDSETKDQDGSQESDANNDIDIEKQSKLVSDLSGSANREKRKLDVSEDCDTKKQKTDE